MITQLQRIKAARHIVVGLLFLFIMVPLMAQMQNKPDVWDGTTIADKLSTTAEGKTSDDPIIINSAAELAYLAQQTNAGGDLTLGNDNTISYVEDNNSGFPNIYFALAKDIDLAGHNWTPIGTFNHYFQGNFDGKGHCVSGLTVKGANYAAGLFGSVRNNTIQNLGVKVHPKGIKAIGKDGNAGGIAGMAAQGTIRNCYVEGTGTVKAEGTTASSAGGIAGYAYVISHCYATVDVKANGGSNSNNAGGIAGNAGQLYYTYATGNVEASGSNSFAGGICGSLIDSYFSYNLALNKEVKGESSNVHRIVGSVNFSNDQPTFNYAFPQMTVNGNTINDGAINNLNGADIRLETFKEDLLEEPATDNGWSDGNGWKWPDDAYSTLLPKLMVRDAYGYYYNYWPGIPAQPDIDAANPAYPRLYIQTPAGITLTVTDANDTDDTPIANGTKVDPGTRLKLSKIITDNNYSFNHYLYGTSADQIDQPINGDTYKMPNQDLWISASVTYTEPEPEPTPEPPYVPIYYTVTIPSVEGATTDPGPGDYEVESWNTFRFYLTLDSGYSDSQPVVSTSRGETLTPRQSDGAYLVKYVRSDVEIRIDSIRPNLPPVANEAINAPANRPRIWTEGSMLCIGMPQMAPASTVVNVITADGRLLQSFDASPGLNRRQLPRGFYIIRISDLARKVMIR